jgi:hypothetical protein
MVSSSVAAADDAVVESEPRLLTGVYAGLSRATVVFLIVPTVLAFGLSRALHFRFDKPVDAEFLLLGAVWAFVPEWVGCVAIVVLMADMLLYGIIHTYYLPLSAIVGRMAMARVVPGATTALWVGAFVFGAAAMCAVAVRLAPRRGPRWTVALLMVGLVVAGLAIDFSRGQGPLRRGVLLTKADLKSPHTELVYLPLPAVLWRETAAAGSVVAGSGLPIDGATSRLAVVSGGVGGMGGVARPNIVLVIAESWGEAFEDSLKVAFERPYRDSAVARRYDVEIGRVPFTGGTVYAEARELCHRDFGFGIMEEAADSLRGCLPQLLSAAGYRTIVVHGNLGRTFDRVRWYPKVGFEEQSFLEDLSRQHLPLCDGFFPGVCDGAIAQWIGDRLAGAPGWGEGPDFIYFLSLNSHLPVTVPVGADPAPSCGAYHATRGDEAVCAWYMVVLRLHQSIARLAARSDIGPTEFVIVGDHAPPFAVESRRLLFSQQDVPFIVLRPRSPAPPAESGTR